MPSPPGFSSPPAQLVDDGRQHLGRFDGPVERANLIDARLGAWPRALRRMRLKEWQALQIATPSLFCNLALFDAKLMSLLQVKVYERARGEKHVREVKLRPGQLRIADNLLDSANRHAGRKGRLAFVNRMRDGRIEVELETQGLAGRLTVHTARGASQVVSLPFAGDTGMYSHKGMFPIEGEITVDGTRYAVDAADSLALLDDHKGYYPYVMTWDWVTSATVDATGRSRGFNLTRNQCRDPEQYNENCAWIGATIGRLPAVTFERVNPRQPGEHWLIRDRDGRVDVRFTPTVPGDVKINAVVVESRYRGPFGEFRGRVEPEGLAPFAVDGMFGMGEEFWLRC